MLQFLQFSHPGLYLLAASLILISAFLQGVGGVGFSMFAAPVAAVFFPALVPGPLLTLGGFVALLTALRERNDIAWPSVGSALAGRAAGSVVAVMVMAQLAPKPMNLLFAGFILLAVMISVAGVHIGASQRNMGVAGILSGLMGTLTSVGAPPLAIALQHVPPANLRATLGITLFCGATFSLLMLWITGHYNVRDLLLSISLLPFLLIGFRLSSHARQYVSPPFVRRALLVFCSVSALGLVLKTL